MFQSGNLKGEIVIRPDLTFGQSEFIQKLGEFCFGTQQVFSGKIGKAISGVYVAFLMSNAQFHPVLPKVISGHVSSTANKIGEIAIALNKTSSDKAINWTFILPLENFQTPKYRVHVKSISKSVLFGRIISRKMMEPVTKLSSTKNLKRTGYTITLESGNSHFLLSVW